MFRKLPKRLCEKRTGAREFGGVGFVVGGATGLSRIVK